MKQMILKILDNSRIDVGGEEGTAGIYEMRLELPGCEADMKPGQFINIKIDGTYLRRPISVCETAGDVLTIVYKVVGKGTEIMAAMHRGDMLDVLAPLGNGFDIYADCGDAPAVIGGGVGAAPCFELCKRLKAAGRDPIAILGFRNSAEAFYIERFKALGIRTLVATEDGSIGQAGFATEPLKEIESSYIFACGPEPMLKALDGAMPEATGGQFSFEERMGCGFGACMGCSCRTKYGSKRICKDGPVLERSEILW